MFTEQFGKFVGDGDSIACDVEGFHCVATVHHDDTGDAPWERDCGHGPVTDWVRRGKAPGERVLNEDHGSYRYYDFARAVELAKRDGWGMTGGKREGETDNQYAARAADHDYQVLRAWCNDEWTYCGIVVEVYREDVKLGSASLWGIEMNYPDSDNSYLVEVANELIDEAVEEAKARRARLTA